MTLQLLRNRGAMRTVGNSVPAQVRKVTKVGKQLPQNAVNPKEITNQFVNALTAMAGTEGILKLAGKNTAKNLKVEEKGKKRQLHVKVTSFSASMFPH